MSPSVSDTDTLERELREREVRLGEADTLAAQGAELNGRADALVAYEGSLDQRSAELEERERRLAAREDALGELKDWLVRRERSLAAYLGDAVEQTG